MQIEDIAKITAPSLFSYVRWVLKRAEEKKIKKLYFIARDGYILHKLAIRLCEEMGIDICCKYLCCSRYSLRIPSFHLMGEERNDLIFCGGNRLTGKIFLSRAGIKYQDRLAVYGDISENSFDENKLLSHKQAAELAKKLIKSECFNRFVDEISIKAYKNTIGYLRQEGLTQGEAFGIVDLGWTGTTAVSLAILLNSCQAEPKITGFYFGLYRKPQDTDCLTSEAFFFNPYSNPFKIAAFSNNLLEALCVAPHGRTASYSFDGKSYSPVFAEYKQNSTATMLLNAQLSEQSLCSQLPKVAIKPLLRLMNRPTRQESQLLSKLSFCDDVCESYPRSITQGEIINCTFFAKLKAKITDKPLEIPFWEYGLVGDKSPPFKAYYQLNIFLWEALRICRYQLSWGSIIQRMKKLFTNR